MFKLPERYGYSLGRLVISAIRAVAFVSVTGPAVIIFLLLMSSQLSVGTMLLDGAEHLVSNAPDGKVWACAGAVNMASEKAVFALTQAPPVLCSLSLQTHAEWIESADREIRSFYMVAVAVSVLIYVIAFSVHNRTRRREFVYGSAFTVRDRAGQREDV